MRLHKFGQDVQHAQGVIDEHLVIVVPAAVIYEAVSHNLEYENQTGLEPKDVLPVFLQTVRHNF